MIYFGEIVIFRRQPENRYCPQAISRQPPGQFLAMIGRYPGVPAALAWAVVLVVVVLLCSDAESRDYLLGHGKTLSVVSVGALLAVLTMTIVGWSITY